MEIIKTVISRIVRLNPKRFSFLSDQMYIQLKFYDAFGRFMDFKNPKTFNEKIQWLKVNDYRPEYTTLVDKHAVKEYIAKEIGAEYVIPTLGVWDNFNDIDFETLPNEFVLKCTHDSGGIVVCKDKTTLDLDAAKKKLQSSLNTCFYWMGRERPYKDVPPRIIAEKYMGDNLIDYKLFCFSGVPKLTLVCSERFSDGGLKEDFYDEEWNHLNIKRPQHENSSEMIEKPKQYSLMRELAEKLSTTIPFSRIDFYEINERVYFGEITFYPASGFEGFEPESWDYILGD